MTVDGGLPSFEQIYADAGGDPDAVPWANLRAHPVLLSYLDRELPTPGRPALVVACGLGDDAEELARRGYAVTAFDWSPTAIAWCRRRFPQSTVQYTVANVLDLPAEWTAGFDLVVEINTLQSLPPPDRPAAIVSIARTVRSGGHLFVRCLAGDDGAVVHGPRPWPVSRQELSAFGRAGLIELEMLDDIPGRDGHRCFRGWYARR